MLVVGFPMAMLLFRTSGPRGKLLALTMMGLAGGAIAKSGSRGGMLGLFMVAVGTLVLLKEVRVSRRVVPILVAAVALAFVAPEGYWRQMATVLNPTEDYNWDSTFGRRQVAIRGIGYMLRYPLFGVGVGLFGRAEGMLSDATGGRYLAAHNSFIQAGAELGVTGLLLWVSLLLGSAVSIARLRRRMPESWLRGTLDERFLYNMALYHPLSLLGFATSSFFLSFAHEYPFFILAALSAGFYRAIAGRLAPSPVAAHGHGRRLVPGRRLGPRVHVGYSPVRRG
jgi:O-antigen ligase